MNSTTQTVRQGKVAVTALLDLSAIALVYFTPTLSHLLSLPLYLIEPMRLMLVLALVHSSKQNAYLLALSLPLFSFLVSGHPVMAKMFLMTGELALNVFLFYKLAKWVKSPFMLILSSILLSKLAYYLLKFLLLETVLLQGNLVATPLWIQLLTMLAFSTYTSVMLSKNKFFA